MSNRIYLIKMSTYISFLCKWYKRSYLVHKDSTFAGIICKWYDNIDFCRWIHTRSYRIDSVKHDLTLHPYFRCKLTKEIPNQICNAQSRPRLKIDEFETQWLTHHYYQIKKFIRQIQRDMTQHIIGQTVTPI